MDIGVVAAVAADVDGVAAVVRAGGSGPGTRAEVGGGGDTVGAAAGADITGGATGSDGACDEDAAPPFFSPNRLPDAAPPGALDGGSILARCSAARTSRCWGKRQGRRWTGAGRGGRGREEARWRREDLRGARVGVPPARDRRDETSHPQREFHAVTDDLVTVPKRFVAMKRLHSLSFSNHAKIPFLRMCHPN